jgi:hypothetical protein
MYVCCAVLAQVDRMFIMDRFHIYTVIRNIYNIKMALQEVGCEGWTGLSWLRRDRWRALVNAVMNLRVP